MRVTLFFVQALGGVVGEDIWALYHVVKRTMANWDKGV